jgi:site-specific recombinase XerC
MTSDQLTTIAPARASRMLTATEFQELAAVPAEIGWLRNLTNQSTRRAYETAALDHQADIAKVQERLGHANIATTRIYDHRRTRPEVSPTFKVAY